MKTLVESLNEALGKKYYEDILHYFRTMIKNTISNKPVVRFFIDDGGSSNRNMLASISDTIDKLIFGMNTIFAQDKTDEKDIRWELYGFNSTGVKKINSVPKSGEGGTMFFDYFLSEIKNIQPFGKEDGEIVNVIFTDFIALGNQYRPDYSKLVNLLQDAGRYNVIVVDEKASNNQEKVLVNIEQKANNVLIVRAQY